MDGPWLSNCVERTRMMDQCEAIARALDLIYQAIERPRPAREGIETVQSDGRPAVVIEDGAVLTPEG